MFNDIVFYAGSNSVPQNVYCIIVANANLGQYWLYRSNRNISGVYTDAEWVKRAYFQIKNRYESVEICQATGANGLLEWAVVTEEHVG